MNLSIAMITCERPDTSFVTTTQSLRKGGFYGHVRIFSEPRSKQPRLPEHSSLVIHAQQKGAFKNWLHACRYLVNADRAYSMLVEDDVRPCRGAAACLDRFLAAGRPFSYVALGTMRQGATWRKAGDGWHAVRDDREIWGTQAIVWSTDLLRQMLDDPAFHSAEEEPYDLLLCQWRARVGLPSYHHVPSLFEHTCPHLTSITGKKSGGGANPKNIPMRRSYRFNPNWTPDTKPPRRHA